MPYVTEKRKNDLDWGEDLPDGAGDLNYMITKICDEYLERKGLRYHYINDIVGALECCKMEFYRRIAAPYENQKIIENGDVYNAELVAQADPNGSVVAPASRSDVKPTSYAGFGMGRSADH